MSSFSWFHDLVGTAPWWAALMVDAHSNGLEYVEGTFVDSLSGFHAQESDISHGSSLS